MNILCKISGGIELSGDLHATDQVYTGEDIDMTACSEKTLTLE